ncbi:MAG: preprotein translocase subunit SecY, partial [Rhodobacteraceae bacterium]|nr:preprotein translocase subunit SecY [Paracoccaceae bacterium]
MASAADQIAANMNFGVLSKATELKRRIWFVLGALIIYRMGTFITLPGIDPSVMAEIIQSQSGGMLGMFDVFAGGALSRMSIFALNIMPYISASIIMQLMSVVIPTLEQLKKEGHSGRRKITQYTRYLTVALATFQSVGVSIALQNQMVSGQSVVINPGVGFVFTAALTLVTGTMFLMWLGEQVTERGIGNGISMIIFAGIVA